MSLLSSLRLSFRRLLRRPSNGAATIEQAVVEQLVEMPVRDLALYEQALRHRSLLRGQRESHRYSNERLEFLGDAVLGFIVAEYLYERFPDRDEGFLTRVRAQLVNGKALARNAEAIHLGDHILMSLNMAQTEGRKNQSILADAFEALIGALYLDLGLPAARRFIHSTLLVPINLDELVKRRDNYKSLLLEFAQARGWPQPTYRVTYEEGPSHAKAFTVEVLVNDQPYGTGTARSKKRAEQRAAREALERMRGEL